MFLVRQKREIAEKVQQILRETGNPELPDVQIGSWLPGHRYWNTNY